MQVVREGDEGREPCGEDGGSWDGRLAAEELVGCVGAAAVCVTLWTEE